MAHGPLQASAREVSLVHGPGTWQPPKPRPTIDPKVDNLVSFPEKVRESKRNLLFVCFWIPISGAFSHASVEILGHARNLLFMAMDMLCILFLSLSFGICLVTNASCFKMYL